jgi:hypothetical protein
LPSNLSSEDKKYQFHGFYQKGYIGGPERPFIRILVVLHRFGVSKQVDMMIDSGSDVTTLQPKDSLLMLDESQFKALGQPREIEGLGGRVKSYTEEGAVGFFLSEKQVCWVPTMFDITDPKSRSTLPSTLGNDVLQFGTTALNAVRGIVKIELILANPLITSI